MKASLLSYFAQIILKILCAMRTPLLTTMLIFFTVSLSIAQPIPPDSLYLGQTPPGNVPLIFAPGRISLPGRVEYGITMSPDGAEMLFATGNWPDKRTLIIEYVNNCWSTPDTVSFSANRSAEEAIYSPDGQRVYYYAYSPPNPLGGADLCYSVKAGTVWSEPVNLGSPLNTPQSEYHPCVVGDTSIYFENNIGKICYSKFQNGAYLPRIVLPSLFNDQGNAWANPYVSPDETYFIFNSARTGGFGGTDLYIAYKRDDGTWTNPKNLGNVINTPTNECGSEITDDNLYMTYVSDNDIYWVSSDFIDSLRYTNFIPYLKNPVPDQTAIRGELFSFTIPDSTFLDDDGNNTLIYNAYLDDGNPLPGWLVFDTLTATFSGIPEMTETLNIMIKATDTAGAFTTATFEIDVEDPTSVDQPEEQCFNIYPNPTNGMLYITTDKVPGEVIIAEITGLRGEFHLRKEFRKSFVLDLTGKPEGMYLLKLQTGDTIFIRKVFKI